LVGEASFDGNLGNPGVPNGQLVASEFHTKPLNILSRCLMAGPAEYSRKMNRVHSGLHSQFSDSKVASEF
jgi:hypothetical protein